MIDRRTARRLSAQLKELRRRRGVREAARAVQAFTSRYDGVTTVPHMGDFDLGQGKVTLREAKRRESMERRELIRTATQLHRLLDRRVTQLAELGRRAFNEGKIKETDAEGYEEARQRLQELFSKESPFPRYAALGAARARVPADALLETAELLHEIVSAMADEHANRMSDRDRAVREGRREIDDPTPGMDGDPTDSDDEDQSTPDSSAEPISDDAKLSKETVDYKYAPDPARSCGECSFFVEPNSCQIVEGLIREVDTCSRWRGAE